MTTIETPALATRWRLLYTVGLLLAFWTAGFGSGGWLGLVTGAAQATFAVPGVVLLLLILGRLIWVWCRSEVLTWPTTSGLRRLAKVSLGCAAVAGIMGVLALMGSGLLIKTLSSESRGAAGLVIGVYLLPLVALAPIGVVVFEWARGWSCRATVPAADRGLLTSAAIVGALLAIAPIVSSMLFPFHSLTRARYNGVLPWVIFALGLGALTVRGLRGTRFPASAVFSTALAAQIGVAIVMMVLSGSAGYGLGIGITLLVHVRELLVSGAAFALTLAVIPGGALAILDLIGTLRSGSLAMRSLIAAPLVLTVAWFGVSTRTKALEPPPAYARERVMSDEQLARQANYLRLRCPEAGTQVFRTQSDVTQLEVRYPNKERQNKREIQLRIDPDSTRPHNWFPMRGQTPAYQLVVFTRNGRRWAYGLDAKETSGYAHVDAQDTSPRYILTWKSLQTPQEEADGIAGNEMTIVDTQDSSVLARRVLFFKRTNDKYGMYQEGCGTLGDAVIPDAYAFKWVTTILIPKK